MLCVFFVQRCYATTLRSLSCLTPVIWWPVNYQGSISCLPLYKHVIQAASYPTKQPRVCCNGLPPETNQRLPALCYLHCRVLSPDTVGVTVYCRRYKVASPVLPPTLSSLECILSITVTAAQHSRQHCRQHCRRHCRRHFKCYLYCVKSYFDRLR